MPALSKIDESMKIDIRFNGDIVPTTGGDIETVTGLNNLRQAIFNRLVTTPGSYAYRPNYGIGIKRFKNIVGNLPVQEQIMLQMQDQFADEPRIESLESLSFERDNEDPSKTVVKLSVRATGEVVQDFSLGPF